MGEVSILGFKKAQVFCIKNSSCVKTGKSLRAIETGLYHIGINAISPTSVKTGKSLRAIETIPRIAELPRSQKILHRVKTGKSLRAIAEIWE